MVVVAKGLPAFNHLLIGGYDIAPVTSSGTLEATKCTTACTCEGVIIRPG